MIWPDTHQTIKGANDDEENFATILSFVAVFTLFIGSPTSTVQASEVNSAVELQQEEKFVTIIVKFKDYPPLNYYYDDGYFKGYITRVSFDYENGYYHALYAGRVYTNAPIEQILPEL